MTLNISATSPRVQYTVGSSSTSTFAYGFPIFQDADLKVFVGSTLKTLTTHYTVTGAGTTSGGNVVMTTGNAVTNADVTIVRDITISRTTDFPTSGSFQVDSLNTELDTITAVQQELEDDISRSLKLSDEDATATLTLPLKDARKGRYLAFNATTGNAEAGPTQTDATAIASVTSDIALLADIQDGTTATNAITTVASANANIQTVASANANITTVANANGNITTIATGTTGGNANLTQINAVAGALTNINTVAGDTSVINTVAGISSDVTAVAGDATDIGAVAGKATEIGLLGTQANIANMTALNGQNVIQHMANLNGTNVIQHIQNLNGTDVITHIQNLNGQNVLSNIANLNGQNVISNIATVAGDTTEIGQLAPKANDITTVAGKISDVEVVAHLEDGTTATSAVSTLSARSSDIQTLAPRASDMQSLAPKATEIGRIGASAGNITSLTTLGTTDAVADMNTLSAISSDITSLANSLEKTYTTTVAGGVFVLDGSNNPAIEVFRGNTYIFNQNDATNDGHPLVFKNGSSAYEVGVTYYLNGAVASQANYVNTTTFNAGRSSGDRKVIIEVASTAPSSGLLYYCYIHGNSMGNTITVKDSNISLVATNIANVNNVGNNISAVTNVNTNLSHVTNVHNNMSDINDLNGSGVIANIGTLATGTTGGNANLTQINAVAVAVGNVNTVATNINSVNDFADKYRIGSSDPSSNNDEGDLFYNTTSNTLKVYTGSAWEAGVTAGSGFAALSGANFTGNISVVGTVTDDGATHDGDVTFTGGTNIGSYNAVWDKTDSALEFGDNAQAVFGAKGILFNYSSGNNWLVKLSGADLIIQNGSTTLFKLDTSGNLTVAGDIITDGSL